MNNDENAQELIIVNKELAFQNEEKEKRASELIIANKELAFQNEEKEKRASELIIANKELAFQNEEKEKRASELIIANKELAFQNKEKGERASELVIANLELAFQNGEKEKHAIELTTVNNALLRQNEEIKFAEEQRAFDSRNLDAMINNTNDLMWSVDRNLKLIAFNKPFEAKVGKFYSQSINRGFSILTLDFPEEEFARYRTNYERAFTGETFTDIEHVTKPTAAWAEVSYFPIRNEDEIIGIACHSRNVTAEKLAELERTSITNDLVRRNKDLEQFSHIVSHNLRAPVANLLGATAIFNNMSLCDEEKRIVSEGINESVSRLDDVINDLNTILQVKQGADETKEPVRFSSLVVHIESSVKSLIEKSKVKIRYDFTEVDSLFTLNGYLYSIFYNLITNSIKYCCEDGDGMLEIKSFLSINDITIEFTDNGIGIDLEKHGDEIFGLYKQFHTNSDGKGMGLFMVKTQVEALGGNITVDSKVGEGTKFTLQFPA
jgi:PAS domain S-box-containing protein